MTLPADKLDAILAGVVRMEAMVTGLDGRSGGIAARVTRVEPVMCNMDAQLRRIAVDVAELKRLVALLPSKTLLVGLLLATAMLAMCAGD